MTTEVRDHRDIREEQEQQAEIEQQLNQQTQERINAVKQQIGDQLDKLGTELIAHLKSTGQTKPKSSPTYTDQAQKDKEKQEKEAAQRNKGS